MCLAVPLEVVEIEGLEAVCQAGGTRVRARLDLLDNPRVGDWVLVHAGFAITKVDPEEARETWRAIRGAFADVP